MSSSGENKGLMIGAAAVGAIALGAAVAYHYWWNTSEPVQTNDMRSKLEKEKLFDNKKTDCGKFDN